MTVLARDELHPHTSDGWQLHLTRWWSPEHLDRSARQVVIVQAGISKEKGKEIIAAIKDGKYKVQAQIQDEQVRVSGKNRDDLQSAISLVKGHDFKIPLQFENFRD